MDIAAGLAAAAQAIRIAQSLRATNAADAATYNARISDLMEKLSDIRLALIDARARQVEVEAELVSLSAAFADQGRLEGRAGAPETVGSKAQAPPQLRSATRARGRATNPNWRAEL